MEHGGNTTEEDIYDLENEKISAKMDPQNYTIQLPILFRLAKKLELATRMNITNKYSSSPYEV